MMKAALVDACGDRDHAVGRHAALDQQPPRLGPHDRHEVTGAHEPDQEALERWNGAWESTKHGVVRAPATAQDLTWATDHVEEAPAARQLCGEHRVDPVGHEVEPDRPVRPLAPGEHQADEQLRAGPPRDANQGGWRHDAAELGDLGSRAIGHEHHRAHLLERHERLEVGPELILVERDGDEDAERAALRVLVGVGQRCWKETLSAQSLPIPS